VTSVLEKSSPLNKRLAGRLGERLGEAVAEVQPGRPIAFAEIHVGLPGDPDLGLSYGLDPDTACSI
jgi:hypothetical protein